MIFQYEVHSAQILTMSCVNSAERGNFDNEKTIVKNLHYEYTEVNVKAPTVVLLHGWGGNYQSFLSIYSAFEGFNILSLDFCGFGQSDKPTADFTIFSYAEIIASLLKHLNLTNAILVGHSFGGRVALILSETNRDVVKRLILIDSAGIKPRLSAKKTFKVFRYKVNKKLVAYNLRNAKCLEKYGSVDYKILSADEKRVFSSVVRQDLSHFAKKAVQETLIIWGEQDKDTPLYMAKKLHKYIKSSKLFVIKSAGHFSYLDSPQAVIKIIKEFLK